MDRRGGEKDASHKIYSAPHDPIYDAYSINRAVERATKDHTFVDNAVNLLDGLKFPTFKNNIINHIKKVTEDLDTITLFESLDGYIEFHDQYHVRKALEVNDPEKQKENQLTDETLQSPIGRNRNISANESIKDAEAVSGKEERKDYPKVTPTAMSEFTCQKCGKSFQNQDDIVRHKRLEGARAEKKKIRVKRGTDRQQTVANNARMGKKVADLSSKKLQTKNEPTDRDNAARFANLLEGLKFPVTKEQIRNHINQKKHVSDRQTLNMILRLIQDELEKGIKYNNVYEIEKAARLVIEKKQRLPDGEKTGNEETKTGNEETKEIKKDIVKETLKPITKVKSKEDKELQEQEVESTGGGMGAGGG